MIGLEEMNKLLRMKKYREGVMIAEILNLQVNLQKNGNGDWKN